MTLQEVCEKYKVAESSMTGAFPLTKKAIEKKYGVRIVKIGRGKNAYYEEEILDGRVLEDKERVFVNNDRALNWDFLVFFAIVTMPMFVFRGSYDDFLKYVEVSVNEDNKRMLKDALIILAEKGVIMYNVDVGTADYFVICLYRSVEEDMDVEIMTSICRNLANKYHKRSWVPLLKTWLGVNMLVKEDRPCTLKALEAMTGLSKYQIKESTRILKESSIYLPIK